MLFHICLVLIFGIGLHTYQFALNYNNKKIFLNMILNIIGRNKIYFAGCHIGKPNFYVVILILMLCTQREMYS